MPTRSRLLLAALLIAAPPLTAQQTQPAITAGDLRLRLFALADDSMGGRATGSLGNFKAADYVAAEFRRLGLEPAGDNGSFFQTIPFYRLRPDDRVVLSAGGTALVLGRDVLPVSFPTRPVGLDGAPVVYGGPLGDTVHWISGSAARGRIVVMGPPGGGRGIGRLLGQIRQSAQLREALLVAIPALDDAPPEMVAALLEGRVVTDTVLRASGPMFALVTSAAAERLLGRPLATATPGDMGPAVAGDLRLAYFPLSYPARNVVAVLRGADRAVNRTYVSVTAHNDHVGFDRSPVDHDSLRAFNRVVRPMGADSPQREPTPAEWTEIGRIRDSLRAVRPPRADSIRNGADDDGSGTVGLLEVAERLAAGPRPARSVLFVSHTAEEEGLVGSEWFTDHPTVPIDSFVAEVDMDMIGRGDRVDLAEGGVGYLEVIGASRLSKEFGGLLARVNGRQTVPFQFNLTYDQPGHPLQYYCRADHYSYARYGIPSVSLSRGEHLDYHQVTDEPQYIDYDALARVAQLVADVATEVAGLDHRPRLDRPKGDPKAPCVQ